MRDAETNIHTRHNGRFEGLTAMLLRFEVFWGVTLRRSVYTAKITSENTPLFNSLNAELNPICHFLALLGVHRILYVSRIMVKI